METHSPPRPPWVQALNQAGWSAIADRVIHGLCHDLSGRAGSLSGLAFLLESQEGGASSVLPFLSQELEGLEETIRLLRLLPDDATEPELLAPGEIFDDLVRLTRAQRGLEGVSFRVEGFAQAPALRIDPTLFIRGVVILLTGMAERATLDGLDGVEVHASGEGDRLRLRVCPGSDSGSASGAVLLPRRIVEPEGMESWKAALAGEGVEVLEVDGPEGGAELQLLFPSPASS